MGAARITDDDLSRIGVEVVESLSGGDRKLQVPEKSAHQYEKLVEDKLEPGFWNDMIGENEIVFIFKLKDGSVKRYILSEVNRSEISQLCHEFSGDPIEKTSDLIKYLGGNSFYREFIMKYWVESHCAIA